GLSPYDPTSFTSCAQDFSWLIDDGYFYPPQFGAIAVLLSSVPFTVARALIVAINLCCLIFLSLLCALPPKSEFDLGVPEPAPESRWLIPALIFGNPFTAHIIWMGQTTLIATATLAGSWVFARKGHTWLGGILLGVATIKPQFALLVILWFVLERRWMVLIIGGLTALTMSIPRVVGSGPLEPFVGWLSALSRYDLIPVNAAEFQHALVLRTYLAAFGIRVPPLIPLCMLALVPLWQLRSRISARDLLSLLLGLSLLSGFSHDYDLCALAPLLPSFWTH